MFCVCVCTYSCGAGLHDPQNLEQELHCRHGGHGVWSVLHSCLSLQYWGLSACLPASLSACVPACLSVHLTSCLPVFWSVCLSVCLPACLSVCLSVCLPMCPLFVFCMSCLCIFLYCFVCALGYLICLSNCVYPFNRYLALSFQQSSNVRCCVSRLSQGIWPGSSGHFTLKKLSSYSLSMASITFLRSYLQERLQCVLVNGTYSQETSKTSGVPQGSIDWFCIFLSDLPMCLIRPSVQYELLFCLFVFVLFFGVFFMLAPLIQLTTI